MALYIKIDENDNAKITGRGHYEDDPDVIEITSWPTDNGNPVNKKLCYWNGSIVQLKTNEMLVAEHLENEIAEARSFFNSRWVDSDKTVAANQAQYKIFKNGDYSTIEEIDIAYDNFISFMDVE